MTIGMLFLLAFAVAEGAITGSFICLVAARLPRLLRESAADGGRLSHVLHGISFPRSHCDCCKAPVRARDLAPIVGYLALRGRCRDCGFAFGSRELVMECIGAGIGLASVVLFGFSLQALACFATANIAFAAFTIGRGMAQPAAPAAEVESTPR